MESGKESFKGDESLDRKFQQMEKPAGDTGDDKPPEETEETGESESPLSRREQKREERRQRREARKKAREDFLQNWKNERSAAGGFNEYWYKDANIAVKVPKPDAPYEELEAALIDNRATLETLKRNYCRSKRRNYETITTSYMHEIKRHVNAIEAIKDVLAGRAEEYRVYFTDREHPDEACRRIVFDCFVSSALYGPYAAETELLRRYRDAKLVTTPLGRAFIRIYYRFIGPGLSRLVQRSPFAHRMVRRVVDRIVLHLGRGPAL